MEIFLPRYPGRWQRDALVLVAISRPVSGNPAAPGPVPGPSPEPDSCVNTPTAGSGRTPTLLSAYSWPP